MNKGFRIGQSNEIIKAGKIYDLHNLYDFIGIFFTSKACRLEISFKPIPEFGDGKVPISLIFEGIDYLEFSPQFWTKNISGLDEMGYKNPEDHDDEWLLSEKQASFNDHLFFRMDSGDFIRIHCQNADLVEIE